MVYVLVNDAEFKTTMVKFVKDYRTRSQFQKFEIQQKILKSLMFNCTLSSVLRRQLCWQHTRLCDMGSFSFIKNRCIFSGRARSVYRFFNLSRLCIKQFFDLKFIPFLKKSSW